MANPNHWKESELRELIALCLQGKETREIAEHFKTTSSNISKMITRLRAEGIPIPRRTAGHKANRHNTPWTQEEVEYVVRRRNERATSEQISIELNRTFYGVQGLILKLRKEGVDIQALGSGQRRLWSVERLQIAIAGRSLRAVA
jgi:transposase